MRSIILILLTTLQACQNNYNMQLTILYKKELEGILSASGMVKHHESYYIIGDDSPYLYRLNRHFETIEEYPVQKIVNLPQTGRIEKKRKPDFEALELVNDNEIIGFGSGSKSPERDVLLRIKLDETASVKRSDLSKFYRKLKSSPPLKNSELNIEAVAFYKRWLYLFNRGKNVIFRINYQAFLDHVDKGGMLPDLEYSEFNLPEIEGIQAGFSGATIDEKTGMVLITASVENTPNAYDDGEVLGSFIGVFRLENEQVLPGQWLLIEGPEKPLKVESVTIDKRNGAGDLDVIMVTDSDGGRSRILRANLLF